MLLLPASSFWAASRSCAHTKTHTGNFLNARDDFSCQKCAERWESSSESDHVSTQATVDGLSGDVCGLCHPGPFPVERRDRKWSGILGGYKPSSVCQTTIRHQIQIRGDSEPSDGARTNQRPGFLLSGSPNINFSAALKTNATLDICSLDTRDKSRRRKPENRSRARQDTEMDRRSERTGGSGLPVLGPAPFKVAGR